MTSMKIGMMACLLALIALPITLPAAEKNGRLVVDIEVEGTQTWHAGRDHGRARIVERYHLLIPLRSDGVPSSVNAIVPGYAGTQIGRAAQAQRNAMRRQGIVVAPSPATPEVAMALQEALAGEMQKQQASCGGDTACHARMAVRYAQESAAIAYPGAVVAGDGGDGAERFLYYSGYPGCSAEIDIRIDNVSEGAYADAGGMIPVIDKAEARYAGNAGERNVLCQSQQLVYDLKEDRIYMYGLNPAAARGFYQRSERGQIRVRSADIEVGGFAELLEWVNAQLRQAPDAGERSAVLRPPARPLVGIATAGATFDGSIEVRLDWRFLPE